MRANPRGIESLIRRAVTGTHRAGWITRGLGLVAVVGAGLIVGTHLSGVARASSPAVNTMPVAKAALFSQQNAALAKAKQHPFPKTNPADYKPPASATPAPPMVGIVATEQSPLPGMQFLPNHVWTASLKGGTWVEVWTGEQEIPKVEGAVYVMTFVRAATGQFSDTLVGLFVAPTSASTLLPVNWSGTTLQLDTSAGQSLSFNATTDTFTIP